jgi:hypothetical protein
VYVYVCILVKTYMPRLDYNVLATCSSMPVYILPIYPCTYIYLGTQDGLILIARPGGTLVVLNGLQEIAKGWWQVL